jgi:hypothetical protein
MAAYGPNSFNPAIAPAIQPLRTLHDFSLNTALPRRKGLAQFEVEAALAEAIIEGLFVCGFFRIKDE